MAAPMQTTDHDDLQDLNTEYDRIESTVPQQVRRLVAALRARVATLEAEKVELEGDCRDAYALAEHLGEEITTIKAQLEAERTQIADSIGAAAASLASIPVSEVPCPGAVIRQVVATMRQENRGYARHPAAAAATASSARADGAAAADTN